MLSEEKIHRLTKGQQRAIHESVGKYVAEHYQELCEADFVDEELLRQYTDATAQLLKPLAPGKIDDGMNQLLVTINQAAIAVTEGDKTFAFSHNLVDHIRIRYQQMKNVDESLKLAETLRNSEVKISEFTKIKTAEIRICEDGDALYIDYSLPMTCECWTLIQELSELHIEIAGTNYVVATGGFHIQTAREVNENGGRFEGRIHINKIEAEDFKTQQKGYYRCMLPIGSIDWLHDIHTYAAILKNGCMMGLMEFYDQTILIHAYPCKQEGQHYLVVETLSESTAEKIAEYVYSVALTIGFVTGHIHLGRCYAFWSATPEFGERLAMSYHTMRPSSNSTIRIFTTNMYYVNDMLKENKVALESRQPLYNVQGEFQRNLQDWLQPDFMQSLFSLIYNDAHIARAVVTLVESANFPLEYQAGVRSIVLETLAHSVPGPKPIENDDLWEKIKGDMTAVLDGNMMDAEGRELITAESRKILDKKVATMNKPTNVDSLARPLEDVAYTITKNDLSALKMRNTFLHGGLVKGSIEKQTEEIFYISLMLHKLCSIIILKRAGFDGYILNNPVLFNCEKAVQTQERPLLKI